MRVRYLFSLLLPLACLGLWQAVSSSRIVSPATLASPIEVLAALPLFFSSNGFLPDLVMTVQRSVIAFLTSVPIGLGIGLALFYTGAGGSFNESFLDFLRSIPATALVPIFLLLFGIGDAPKIAAGVFSSSLVICLATLAGLKNRNLTRLAVTKILRIPRLQRFVYLDLPESLSQIFVGLRAG